MTTYKTTEEAIRDLEMALYEIKTKGITRLKGKRRIKFIRDITQQIKH